LTNRGASGQIRFLKLLNKREGKEDPLMLFVAGFACGAAAGLVTAEQVHEPANRAR
jgi:predicted metal-binding protein